MEWVVVVILVRGGLKGILGKNIKLFFGFLLVVYLIWVVLGVEIVFDVVVFSDDVVILKVVCVYGVQVFV